jgi:hypothetical protein
LKSRKLAVDGFIGDYWIKAAISKQQRDKYRDYREE